MKLFFVLLMSSLMSLSTCDFFFRIFLLYILKENLSKFIQDVKKIEQIPMDFKKSSNSFDTEKNRLPNYLLHNIFWPIFNNFSALILCKINVPDIFNKNDFFQIFYILRIVKDRFKLLIGSVYPWADPRDSINSVLERFDERVLLRLSDWIPYFRIGKTWVDGHSIVFFFFFSSDHL